MLFSSDILKSIKTSVYRNGVVATLSVLAHYFQSKKSTNPVYSFYFHPFKRSIQLRQGTSDFSVFRQIAMNGEYDIDIPIQPKIIIDAGANIGLASLYFHARFPLATIYSLEPDPGNYRALAEQTRNVSLIKPFPYALWGKTKKLALFAGGVDAWGIQVREAEADELSSVSGIDLSTFMIDQNIETIDLLKIDIEGAEVELFQGEYSYWLPRTKVIIIELHETIRPGAEQIFYSAIQSIRHKVQRSGENMVIFNLDLL
jgi:FkbM family methyltransferase